MASILMFEHTSLGHRLRFLARDSLVYGLAGALNKALALITFPLLARHFSVVDFGTIDYLNTWSILIATLLMFGLDVTVARFYYEYDQKADRAQIISQGLAVQVLVMGTLLPIAWLVAPHIAHSLGLSENYGSTLVRLVAVQAPFFVFTTYSLNLLKWTFKGVSFLLISVGTTVFTIVALVVAMAIGRLDMTGVFVVYLASRMLSGLLGLWLVRDLLAWPRGFDRMRAMLPFALPYAITCVIVSFVPVFERWLVGGALGALALGYYAAGSKVATLISLPIFAMEMSWHPFSVSLRNEKDAARTFNIVLIGGCLILFGGTLALSSIAELVVSFLGSKRYEGAGVVAFALSMGLAVQSIGSISAIGVLLSKKAHLRLYSYGAMLVAAVVATPILAHQFGIAGAAWGIMTSMVVKTVVETWLAQNAWPLPWRFGPAALIGGFTLLVGLLQQIANGAATIHGVELISLLGLILMLPLAWYGALHHDERDRLIVLARSTFKL